MEMKSTQKLFWFIVTNLALLIKEQAESRNCQNGKYKIISFFAKKARGLMSAYIIKNRIEDPAKLKKFKVAGYRYDKESSTPTEWVYLRDEPQ